MRSNTATVDSRYEARRCWVDPLTSSRAGFVIEWAVCGDCRRAYRRGEHRAVWVTHEDDDTEELVELCPYPDCRATIRHDGID
jgi:hypothetical protein